MILGIDEMDQKWIYLFKPKILMLQLNQGSVKNILGLKVISNKSNMSRLALQR
jgi:hypothetical protein